MARRKQVLYMASIIYDPTTPPLPDDPKSLQPEHARLEQELTENGQFRAGGGLYPVQYGKRVRRRRAREPLITDGPFAETKEAIGGVYIYECTGWDEALAIAARIPVDSRSFVEVRPVGIWNSIEAHIVNPPGSWT
jgi:hypothetical protein